MQFFCKTIIALAGVLYFEAESSILEWNRVLHLIFSSHQSRCYLCWVVLVEFPKAAAKKS